MRRTEEFAMHSGRIQENLYANSSRVREPKIENRTKMKEPPAAKNPHGWVIITMVVLLILVFFILVIFISLLFIFYNSITEQQSRLKNDVKNLISQLEKNKQGTKEVLHLEEDVSELTSQLQRQTQERSNSNSGVKRDVSVLQESVVTIMDDLSTIKKGVANPKCSAGWKEYGLSCYNLSTSSLPWNDSKKDCEERNSHLVVINNKREMDFLGRNFKANNMWIGLTDMDGAWKWVDGTPYDKIRNFWEAKQPDDWEGHGLGGGEDCVVLWNRKKWNDDHCSQSYQYICEKKIF